nr:tRNA G37 N-methylase Trm5 [Mucilaginibacter sp. E4BP6]
MDAFQLLNGDVNDWAYAVLRPAIVLNGIEIYFK